MCLAVFLVPKPYDVFTLQGTISSTTDEPVKEGAMGPDVIDTVVEGRLGGGEETIYSPQDGPPLHQADPKPRS